uniref:Uncharacterized protein n=1 Tax=Oryza glumipatula TaxID=40148 RepID=A0A0E0AYE5_9ORYZ
MVVCCSSGRSEFPKEASANVTRDGQERNITVVTSLSIHFSKLGLPLSSEQELLAHGNTEQEGAVRREVAQYLVGGGVADLGVAAQCLVVDVVGLVRDGLEVLHPPLHGGAGLALRLGVGQLALDGQKLALQLVAIAVDAAHASDALDERAGRLADHPAHHREEQRFCHASTTTQLALADSDNGPSLLLPKRQRQDSSDEPSSF